MARPKFTEPSTGSEFVADAVSGDYIFGYREVPVDTWADIDYAAAASPGTAERPDSNTSHPCKGAWVIGNPFNSDPIAAGPSSATKATQTLAGFRGIPVYPGQAVWFPVSNTNLIYIDTSGTDQYAVVYLTHTDS